MPAAKGPNRGRPLTATWLRPASRCHRARAAVQPCIRMHYGIHSAPRWPRRGWTWQCCAGFTSPSPAEVVDSLVAYLESATGDVARRQHPHQ